MERKPSYTLQSIIYQYVITLSFQLHIPVGPVAHNNHTTGICCHFIYQQNLVIRFVISITTFPKTNVEHCNQFLKECSGTMNSLSHAIFLIFSGKEWIKQMALGATLFPVFISGVAFVINFIAIYYHASRAIPFSTMVKSLFVIGIYFTWKIHLLSGCYGLYLCICNLTTNTGWHYPWSERIWST